MNEAHNRAGVTHYSSSSEPPKVRDLDNFVELFRAIWRRAWFIAAFTIIVVGITALVVWQIPPTYRAEAKVIIQTQETNIIDVTTGLPTSAEEIASQVEILRSRFLAERVVRTLGLQSHRDFNGVADQQTENSWLVRLGLDKILPSAVATIADTGTGSGESADTGPEVKPAGGTLRVAARSVGRGLEIGQRGTSRVIGISFTSTHPRIAADIVNTLADTYITSQVEAKSESTRSAIGYLDERLAELRAQVETAEQAVEEYRAETRILQGVNATLLTEEISRLQAESARARAGLAQAEARQGLVAGLAEDGDTGAIIEVINSPVVQQQKVQETTLLSRMAELETQFGPRHPEALNVRAELAELRRKMAEEVRLTIQSVETETAGARAQVVALEQEIEGFRRQLDDQNRAAIQLRALEREAEANRDIFERFLERSKRTDQDSVQAADARVISYAEVPRIPVGPPKKLFLAAAFLASSLLAGGIVLVLELMDKTIRSPQDVTTLIGLRPLAVIPHVAPPRGMTATEFMLQKPSSAFAEAIRSLLLNVSSAKKDAKIWLLTSALPAEGKSFAAVNLARLAGGRGRRVLLIDCDVRRATVHQLMKARNDVGLMDVLTEAVPVASVIKKDDKLADVDFMTAGRYVSDSVEVFQSKRMAELLQELRGQYDLIILDTPPVLALSDTKALAQRAEATLLLVRWKKTTQNAVAEAIRELKEISIQVDGAVLTQVDLAKYQRYDYSGVGLGSKAYTSYYVD